MRIIHTADWHLGNAMDEIGRKSISSFWTGSGVRSVKQGQMLWWFPEISLIRRDHPS